MKVLANRFQVTMTGWKPDRSDREELRLLPKLLYRAELSEPSGPDPGWIDGGVFAFVQGTDPEAILVLEAVRQNGHPRWQYAFARATSAGLEARLDKTVVWSVEFLVGAGDIPEAADDPQPSGRRDRLRPLNRKQPAVSNHVRDDADATTARPYRCPTSDRR